MKKQKKSNKITIKTNNYLKLFIGEEDLKYNSSKLWMYENIAYFIFYYSLNKNNNK